MKSSGNHPFEKDVHYDEFKIGTPQKGEPGTSMSKKKMRVVVALNTGTASPEEVTPK